MSEPLWRRDPERWVDRRVSELRGRAGLREPVARTIAWSELGYSSSGIAKRVEVSEGTVRSYLDDVADRFGRSACWAKAASELEVDAPIGGDGGGSA